MAQNDMLLNIIISFVYLSLLLEKYINHSFKVCVTYFLHTVMLIFMFYGSFVLFTSVDDNNIWEKAILDDQINRVNRELIKNTDISLTGSLPEHKYPKGKTIKTLYDYLLVFGIFLMIAIISYLIHRKYDTIHYDKLKFNIIPVIILGVIEYLFATFIGQQMIFETEFTDITSTYLNNMKKHSSFV